MKCVLLAAGYATRLYPLTRDLPKGLLEVGGRTILDRIFDKIENVDEIDEIILVTNARFYGQFKDFLARRASPKKTTCLNDGTTDNENRLGALADLRLAITESKIDGDLLVLAADNLFEFELSDFVSFFRRVGTDCITTHVLPDVDELRRTGVIELSDDRRVLSFAEKPKEPKSQFAVPPVYLYTRATLHLIREYLASGENPDAPGHFIPWLIGRKPVHAFLFTGLRYDIGDLASYKEAQRVFEGR